MCLSCMYACNILTKCDQECTITAFYILKCLQKIHRRKVNMDKVKGSMEMRSSMQLTKDMAGIGDTMRWRS